jgi:Mg/Co/Ni transporter MgtE
MDGGGNMKLIPKDLVMGIFCGTIIGIVLGLFIIFYSVERHNLDICSCDKVNLWCYQNKIIDGGNK